MTTKPEKAAATRARIVAVARRLFAAAGYEGTSTEAVLEEAGVSRGALYHHFENKAALFAAVLEAVETDVTAATARARANVTEPVQALRAACDAFLQMACDPEVRQIILIDAHSVVGWQTWREIEERHGFGRLKQAFKAIAATGRIPENSSEMFAHIVLASLIEIAFVIARAPDPVIAAREGRNAMNELLTRLLGA
ncbi:MAG TPA: TetR/AcrR family transcriptional regulator [Candidatus Acidoferrales bacterium]|nr:TetR/AcrR family transcriptional regulator [Candidatus Acidoferrales bacterium]